MEEDRVYSYDCSIEITVTSDDNPDMVDEYVNEVGVQDQGLSIPSFNNDGFADLYSKYINQLMLLNPSLIITLQMRTDYFRLVVAVSTFITSFIINYHSIYISFTTSSII